MLLLAKIFTILSLSPTNVWAQPMGCFDWRIEICSEVKPPASVLPSCTNPFPYNPCNSVYYYVYLSKAGNPNDVITPYQFYFSEFNLSGSVIVTPSPITSRKTSKPNEGVSLMCSPPGLNDSNDPTSPLYGVDEAQKTFSYKVIDSGTPTSWTVFGRRLLCVLAIDAYPGEIIDIGQLSGSVKFFNGNVCNLIFSGCDGGLIPTYQVVPPTPCIATGFQLRQGTAAAAPLPGYPNRKKIPNQPQWVYPIKEDNPLNGVTTYDLVLISKHILGIEPFNPPIPPATSPSPYKIIAADANSSNSITTFDIVELRKLILGIYGPQQLPNPPNPWPYRSYRFFDKTVQLQDIPFSGPMPEWVQVNIPPLGTVAAFYGVKIGDVNNTAVGANLLSADDRTATTTPLGFVPFSGKKGAMLRIPVFAQDALGCNSWQLGIGYDPLQWKLTGVVWASQMGEMPEQAWNEPSLGNIRLLSYNAIGDLVFLPKGTPLFYLEGELLQDASDVRLWLNDEMEGFPSESYGSNGDRDIFNLLAAEEAQIVALPPSNPSSDKDTWSAYIYPNPAGKSFRVNLTGPEDGTGTIRFFNSLGQVAAEQSISLIKGENIITSASLPVIPPGQYIVEIASPWGKKSLRLVKN